MNGNTEYLIYLIICNKCYKNYVGETKRKLKERLINHRSDIKLNKNTSISLHVNDINHTIK